LQVSLIPEYFGSAAVRFYWSVFADLLTALGFNAPTSGALLSLEILHSPTWTHAV